MVASIRRKVLPESKEVYTRMNMEIYKGTEYLRMKGVLDSIDKDSWGEEII